MTYGEQFLGELRLLEAFEVQHDCEAAPVYLAFLWVPRLRLRYRAPMWRRVQKAGKAWSVAHDLNRITRSYAEACYRMMRGHMRGHIVNLSAS